MKKSFMTYVMISGALTALVSCGPLPPPLVSDFNGASVKIQDANGRGPYGMDPPRAEAIAEATRICGTAKKRAEFASTTYAGSTYVVNHLFLCL
jgi:hypothetical protein